MHELLEAIGLLFSVLLEPFTQGSDPSKKWIKVTGILILVIAVLCLLAVVAVTLLSSTSEPTRVM